MKKSVYIAGRANRAKEFRVLSKEIEGYGHLVVSKWFDGGQSDKPYRCNVSKANLKIIRNSLRQAGSADVFVLFSEPGMRGTYVEMGAFLHGTLQSKNTKAKMFVVGGEEETHIFESAPNVFFVKDKQQLLSSLKEVA